MSGARRGPRVVLHIGELALDGLDPGAAARITAALQRHLEEALRQAELPPAPSRAPGGSIDRELSCAPGQEPRALAQVITAAIARPPPRGGEGR
jgi:hypothetical protein